MFYVPLLEKRDTEIKIKIGAMRGFLMGKMTSRILEKYLLRFASQSFRDLI